jgi:excisionase family DNA binding protein
MEAVQITQTIPVETVAARLGVSSWTVRSWLRQGRIPSFKIGRRVLVKVTDVEALLEASYRKAPRPA